MNDKLKISFEVTDNYDNGGFRNFVKYLLSCDYDVFIISNDDSSRYINGVAEQLGIPINNRKVCNFTDDKLKAIIDNQIDIHFDNLQSFVILVDSTTQAHGILVSAAINKYYNEPDYSVVFKNTLAQIKKDSEEKS